jgi:hypothetical protein
VFRDVSFYRRLRNTGVIGSQIALSRMRACNTGVCVCVCVLSGHAYSDKVVLSWGQVMNKVLKLTVNTIQKLDTLSERLINLITG